MSSAESLNIVPLSIWSIFNAFYSGTRGVVSSLNLIKLSVGTESVESLALWQLTPHARRHNGHLCHVTRMWPRRGDEVLDGGSIYWVIRGMILARQRIVGFKPHLGEDGVNRCAILLNEDLIRTLPVQRKAFQGWRYLPTSDAPADLDSETEFSSSLPPTLEQELTHIGVLARTRK